MSDMRKEVGSTFWLLPDELDRLPKRSLKSPEVLNIGEGYLSTCRSAIGMVLDTIRAERKVALIPAFTCESVLIPFIKRGYEAVPYPVEKDLGVNWNSFKTLMDKICPSVILIHAYFGFDTIKNLRLHVHEIRERGIVVIEDMTQSMFSSVTPLVSDFHVGSIRKWMPLPDGAFVTLSLGNSVAEEDEELVNAKVKAMTEKGKWIMYGEGDKETFRKDFSEAERILDSRENPFRMSSISKEIYATTDISRMREIRRMNYRYLEREIWNDEQLSEQFESMLSPLGENECPFHFPVLVKNNRQKLQQYLAANDIYATVIWRIPEEFERKINDDARYIYNHILCFHIDQRYDLDDMERIVSVLKHYSA